MRFFYLRDENNNPIGCLASQLNEAKDTISFAVSVCNPLDQFKKQQAKEIAAGRLALGQGTNVPLNVTKKGTVKRLVMTLIAVDNPVQRAREAAQRWLDNYKSQEQIG